MLYISTRGASPAVSSARAIVDGLAPDGGLYVMAPGEIPQLDWRSFLALDYPTLASKVLSALLSDFDEAEAKTLVTAAYTGKFSDQRIAPLHAAGDDLFLELFHGPTSAFKDVALCLLPHLMKRSAEKLGDTDDILILTATSGDTGKAALEGFRDVEGIRILVFYPRDGVSAVQTRAMVSGVADGIMGVGRVLGVLVTALGLLAIVFLAVAFVLSARGRMREFAALRMSGASRSMLARMAVLESAIEGALGALIGIALGLVVFYCFGPELEHALGLPFLLPGAGQAIGYALGTLVVGVGASIASSAFATVRLCRVDAGQVLREG